MNSDPNRAVPTSAPGPGKGETTMNLREFSLSSTGATSTPRPPDCGTHRVVVPSSMRSEMARTTETGPDRVPKAGLAYAGH